ncbi:MAG TPA: AI-2E family transporter [Bryobacteraceae bacterium]|nr:AI-2E family transporter [Bryobacteraceae bacterium]
MSIALLVWFGVDTLLLAFASLLTAIVFHSAARFVSRFTGLTQGWSLALALLVAIVALLAAAALIGSRIAAQTNQLQTDLPQAWEKVQAALRASEWGSRLLGQLPEPGELLSAGYRHGGLFSAFSTVLSGVATLLIVGFVGLYFAAEPDLYRRGLLQLAPKSRQKRAGEVFDRLGDQLRHWLLGKLALMLFVGIATWLGLWILKMPLLAALALLAALLDFIPNIGPILSAIPALLLAFTQSTEQVLWVAGLYLTVQVVESYILQPLVQQRAVSLPPALTLLGQVLIATLFGAPGLILATPLTVVAMNLVQMLYVEDVVNKGADAHPPA